MKERIMALLNVLGSKVGLFLLLSIVIATSAGYVIIRWTHPELTRHKIEKHPVLGRYQLTYVDERLIEAKFRVLQDKPVEFFDTAEGKMLTAVFFFDLARVRPNVPLFRLALNFLREAERKHYDINRVLSLRYDILQEMLERRMAHHLIAPEMDKMARDPALSNRLARDSEFHRLQAHRYAAEENDEKAEEEIERYFDLRRARGATARRLARFEVARTRFALVRGTLRADLRDRLAASPPELERVNEAAEMLKRAIRDLDAVLHKSDDVEEFRRKHNDVWNEAEFMYAWSQLLLSKMKKVDPLTGAEEPVLKPGEMNAALNDAARRFQAIEDSPAATDWAPQCRLLRAEAQLALGRRVLPAIEVLDLLRKRLVDPGVAFAAHVIYADWLTGERRNREAHEILKTALELRSRFPESRLKYRDEIELEAVLRKIVTGLVRDAAEFAEKERKVAKIEPYYLKAAEVYQELRRLPQTKDVPAAQIKYIYLEGELREKLAEIWAAENRDRSKESWVEAARRFDEIIRTPEFRRKLSLARREALYRRAAADYRKGGFNPGALDVYMKLLDQFRDSPYRSVILLEVARTYRDLHDYDEAIGYFNRNISGFSAREGRPEGKNVPETKFELAQVLLLRDRPEVKEGEKIVQKSDRAQAIELLEGLLLHPNVYPRSSLWKRALYSSGIEHIKAGMREIGESKLQIALDRFGTDPLALNAIELLGGKLFEEKEYKRAREIFEKAQYVSLEPGDDLHRQKKLFAMFSVGSCLLKERKYKEAIIAFESTAREAGDRVVTVWAYSQIGVALDALAVDETDPARKRDFIRRAENARALGERRLQKIGNEAFKYYPKVLDRAFHEKLFREIRE